MAVACVDLLLSIPESISCTLFSEWIVWKDLFKVDAAYCQRSARAFLHELFKQLRLTTSLHIYSNFSFSKTFMAWFISREVKFSELSLTQDWSADLPQGIDSDFTLTWDTEFCRKFQRQISSFLFITGRTLIRFDGGKNCSADWLYGLSLYTTRLQQFYWDSNEPIEGRVISQLLQHNQFTLSKLTVLTNNVRTCIKFDFLLPELVELEDNLPHSVAGLFAAAPNLKWVSLHMNIMPASVLSALSGHSELRSITLHDVGRDCAKELAVIGSTGVALYLHCTAEVKASDLETCLPLCTNVKLIECELGTVSGACFENYGRSLQSLIIHNSSGTNSRVSILHLSTALSHCTTLASFSLEDESAYLPVANILKIIRALPVSLRVLTLLEVPDNPRIRETIARCLPHVVDLNITDYPAEETGDYELTDDDVPLPPTHYTNPTHNMHSLHNVPFGTHHVHNDYSIMHHMPYLMHHVHNGHFPTHYAGPTNPQHGANVPMTYYAPYTIYHAPIGDVPEWVPTQGLHGPMHTGGGIPMHYNAPHPMYHLQGGNGLMHYIPTHPPNTHPVHHTPLATHHEFTDAESTLNVPIVNQPVFDDEDPLDFAPFEDNYI